MSEPKFVKKLSGIKESSRFLALLLALVQINFLGIQHANAVSLANPTFTFSQGSNATSVKLVFTADSNAASYTVRIYETRDYSIPVAVIENYVSGSDINGGDGPGNVGCLSVSSSTFICSAISNNRALSATITAIPKSGVTGPAESSQSNAIRILNGGQQVSGVIKTSDDTPVGIIFKNVSSVLAAASMTIYLYRTNRGLPTNSSSSCSDTTTSDLNTIFATYTNVDASGAETLLSVDPGYCYEWSVKYIAPVGADSNGITWYDSYVSTKSSVPKYVPRQITPPTNLAVTPNDQKLNLSWTAPVNTLVTDFRYAAQVSTDGVNWLVGYPSSFTSSSTSGALTGYYDANFVTQTLTNGVGFYVRLQARGNAPDSKNSTWVVTGEKYAPGFTLGAPGTFQGTSGDGQVSFTWTPPNDVSGGAVTNYKVQYSDDNTNWNDGLLVASTARSGTITGLTNGTEYYFRIAAVNGSGIGTYFTPIQVTPYGTPTISVAISSIDSTTATVAISGTSKGRTVTPSITYGITSSSTTTINLTATNSSSFTQSAQLTGLTPGQTYLINAKLNYNVGVEPTL